MRIPLATSMQRQQGAALLIMLTMMVLASSYILVKKLNSKSGLTEKNNQTLATLGNIKEALLGFNTVNTRLPCPAIPKSFGKEDPNPFGVGPCTVLHGFVPAVSLGIAGPTNLDGLLLDAWGNPIRYSFDLSNLRVCSTASCSSPVTGVTAVIYSMGADGALRPTSTDQSENGETRTSTLNAGPLGIRYWVSNDPDFVSHEYSTASGNEFDDLVRWVL